MTTTTPPGLAAGLAARAVHTARGYRATNPDGIHRHHGRRRQAPTTPTLSPHVLDAVSALLATTYGYDAERRPARTT